ncbi:symmetrical bis(5'-nucleosyl)-tetraphosphatase [Candidatus Methylopumilus turicensis]|uniref:Bis(5'-nucleosyl)-tetraphosphatase, symmetrical n=1 Tax=Candidatus Methylopumilus turicensis TaxID=1581680 RepID=A0A0B7IY96_9PROT|nr:symmetrical bis(5'-nucleosyl)-tetraphosphatase [Candidatus Methylopumilus turicensis]CEN55406.1 Bis(5'-nucleosyl)-tetraphosphatase, symmetrical [Candidatus Methylopumilus turicensis]
MATYAIGDIQGCFHSFQALLKKIKFNPASDKLWLVGDLINRGSGSLEVLRWVFDHQSSIVTVLGNHDLHALVVAEGFVSPHRSDTIQTLLDAPDADSLLNWLRHQPLLHVEHDYLMVHAGLLPQWTSQIAQGLAKEVSQALSADDYREFLKHMYGNQPAQWHDALTGWDRLRVITNAMTRLRVCTQEGEMEFKFKGELVNCPKNYAPWFDLPKRASADIPVIFGHWSALGLYTQNNVFGLDTGCLWGGALTALRLEDKAVTQVPCHADDAPISIHFAD